MSMIEVGSLASLQSISQAAAGAEIAVNHRSTTVGKTNTRRRDSINQSPIKGERAAAASQMELASVNAPEEE